MIPKSQWIKRILTDIKDVADLDFQRRAWIEYDPKCICDFDELISNLYNGSQFDEFIEKYEDTSEFPEKQMMLLKNLYDKIEEFYYKPEIYSFDYSEPCIDCRKVFYNPDWHEIRLIAQEVLEAFKDFDIREESENDT